jgi:tryptophan synthase alpha chain
MSRIAARFATRLGEGRKLLVPFLTAGDPDPSLTVELMHTLVAAGADLIELGVPFSDPMADGPVIQRASERALAKGVGIRGALEMVARFRADDADTPVVLMGYLNPIEAMGHEAFARAAREVGVDGVLTVDLPPEEAEDLIAVLRGAGLDPIFLLAPTSTRERMTLVGRQASGFVYYVSLKGVTGSDRLDTGTVGAKVEEIRGYASVPVGVGFGIRDAETAARVARVADAVVVGSALVRLAGEHGDDPARLKAELGALVGAMRRAMDEVTAAPEPAA